MASSARTEPRPPADAAPASATPARARHTAAGWRLPVEPLRRAVARAGGLAALGLDTGRSEDQALLRRYHRAVSDAWVTIHTADILAVRLLRVHPSLVWGRDWWATPDDAG